MYVGSFSTPGMKAKNPNFLNPYNSMSLLVAPSWSTSDLDTMSLSSSCLSLNGSPLDSNTGSFRHRFTRSKRTSLDSTCWRSRSEQSEEVHINFYIERLDWAKALLGCDYILIYYTEFYRILPRS